MRIRELRTDCKQIQLTSGCPNNCSYCYEPTRMDYFDLEKWNLTGDFIQIQDMNFLANPLLSVFVLVNWKIPFRDCVKKLDLFKVWNVKCTDCCYDGGYPKSEIDFNNNKRFNDKRFWDYYQIKRFRAMSRKHNQIIGS